MENLTAPQTSDLDRPRNYVYKMIQVAPSLIVQSHQEQGQEAANYLEQIVNQWAATGWEFYRVDAMAIFTPVGCLGALFGGQPTTTQYYVVTFRRPT